MKAAIITIGILGLCSSVGLAQGIGSIFTQQDDKDKTMLQQIALQETYLSEIKTGYKDTQNGLNTANELKTGSFNLNQNYFNSLSQVSPAVKNNPKIKLIATYQQQITGSFDAEITWQKQQAILATDEISYIQQVYSNLLSACNNDLNELSIVITPGKAQMKDEERINHIDAIYNSTSDKYKFSISFIQNAHACALGRQSGKQQSQTIKKLYDIN
jgi:hypothetical protein